MMDAAQANDRQRLLATAQEARQAGKRDAAAAACAELLRAFPDDPSCLSLAAALAADQGDVERGMQLAGRALAVNPSMTAAHFTFGRLYEMQQRLVEAEASYGKALALDPSNARAHNNLGVVLQMQGKVPAALAAYRKAVELAPELPEANQNFASIIRDSEAMQRAVAGFRRRIVDNPSDADSYNSLANGLRELGRHEEALEAYGKAMPCSRISQRRDSTEPWCCSRSATTSAAGPSTNGASRPQATPFRRLDSQSRCGIGRETARTVLLHAEQGLGDTLQFARFAPLAAARCGAVVLECQPELRPLLLTMKGAPQVVARGDPLPAFEMRAPLMSLPALLGTTLATLPWDGPYLQAPHERVMAWRKAFSKRRAHFNVGLVWAGRPQHWDDLNRSIPLAKFAPLGRVPGAAFFSLQLGDPAAEAKSPPQGMAFFDLTEPIRDFADTAALVSFLDLVITVDTSIAHLAGAMGVPTWVLLARAPDWRWHIGREDSPWYPSVRLFRQTRDGDWSGAIDAAAAELERLARLKAG